MSKRVLYVILSIVVLSCAKESLTITSDELIGSWDLIEICYSPGDISLICNAPEFEESFSFLDNGSFTMSTGESTCNGDYIYSATADSEQVEFINVNGNCERTSAIHIITVSSADSLHLGRLGCNEQCLWKYVKK